MNATTITGVEELDHKLARLSRSSSRRAVTSGIRAGLTPLGKAMRAGINASDASPELKRAARKTIGKRFARAKGGQGVYQAKVGFAVGMKHKAVRRAVVKARKKKRAEGGMSRGVGISAFNIHWFVLGTKQRRTKSGHATGRIPAFFEGVVGGAFAVAGGAALAAARAKIRQVIQREARKKG